MNNHERFFKMIDQIPRIAHLWDREKREIKLDQFEYELGVMSSSEVHMAKFFAAVWFNNNNLYGFDLVSAAGDVDFAWLKIITDWTINPFYP